MKKEFLSDRGCLVVKTDADGRPSVEASLIDGTCWLTAHQMAEVLEVFISAVTSNLRVVFRSGILQEEKVTATYKYEHNGRRRETVFYNLEVLIALCYRIDSLNARVIRKWNAEAISEYGKAVNGSGSVYVLCPDSTGSGVS